MTWIRICAVIVGFATPAFACQTVDGDRILGKDLAAASSVFASIDPNLEIGSAPLPGARRVMRPQELHRLAEQRRIAAPLAFSDVCFERATEPLTSDKLMPVLKQALGEGAPDVEILDFSRAAVPPGTLEFDRSRLAVSGLWPGRLTYAGEHTVMVWVKIRAHGDAQDTGEFAAARLSGIERGDKVAVQVTSGGALLAFEAQAESSARVGESVLVRNPANGRLFQARVQDKGKVVVTR